MRGGGRYYPPPTGYQPTARQLTYALALCDEIGIPSTPAALVGILPTKAEMARFIDALAYSRDEQIGGRERLRRLLLNFAEGYGETEASARISRDPECVQLCLKVLRQYGWSVERLAEPYSRQVLASAVADADWAESDPEVRPPQRPSDQYRSFDWLASVARGGLQESEPLPSAEVRAGDMVIAQSPAIALPPLERAVIARLSDADLATRMKWARFAEAAGVQMPIASTAVVNLHKWVPAVAQEIAAKMGISKKMRKR